MGAAYPVSSKEPTLVLQGFEVSKSHQAHRRDMIHQLLGWDSLQGSQDERDALPLLLFHVVEHRPMQ